MATLAVALVAVALAEAATRGGDARVARRGGYATHGECDGLPALPVRTAAGICVGLAARGLGLPRGVLPLADGRVLVADLGRWDAPRGRLLELRPGPGGYAVRVLLTGLDRPHGLRMGPDGRVWLAEAGRLGHLDAGAARPELRTEIDGLPADGRHPLKSFAFGPDGALYVSIGAPSDHCEDSADRAPDPADVRRQRCLPAEGPRARAAVWRFVRHGDRWESRVFARGLRNSMGLAVDPDSGRVWQVENSRDRLPGPRPDAPDRPADELNLLVQGRHYGWPWCFDRDASDPSFGPTDCTAHAAPVRLLPAHAAPLGVALWDGPAVPTRWRRSLVLTYHGYRANGQRIVAFRLGDDGMPRGASRPLVDGWAFEAGVRPVGAPTDIHPDARGRLWITEDRNGTLLVLVATDAARNARARATR